MVKPVVQNPNPVLHRQAEQITNFKDKNLHKLLREMQYTLKQQDGLGLAAPQIGVGKAIFIIPPDYAPSVRTLGVPFSLFKPLRPTVYINPRIINYSEKKEKWEEGCLSIKGAYYKISRSVAVTLQAYTENGKKFTVNAQGLLAKIYQHETDHLNGLLIINRLH